MSWNQYCRSKIALRVTYMLDISMLCWTDIGNTRPTFRKFHKRKLVERHLMYEDTRCLWNQPTILLSSQVKYQPKIVIDNSQVKTE